MNTEPAALKKARDIRSYAMGSNLMAVSVILTKPEAFELLDWLVETDTELAAFEDGQLRDEVRRARINDDPYPLLDKLTLYGMSMRAPVPVH